MKDFWISFVQLAKTWCPVLPDGHVAYGDEVSSLPEGPVVGEYDMDSGVVMISKEFFEDLGASVKFYMEPVESSNIVAIGYSLDLNLLDVKFVGGDMYRYFGVPGGIHYALMIAKSHGKYLAKEIKGKFDYFKVTNA